MTTIVYRDGVMAGDMRGVWGEWSRASETKVFASAALGVIAGVCGSATLGPPVLLALSRGEEAGAAFDVADLMLDLTDTLASLPADDRSGVLLAIDARRDAPFRRLVQISRAGVEYIAAPWHAMGGDAAIAVGALAMGATARQAVAVAIRHGVCSGGDVEWVELGGSDRVYRDAVSDLVPPPPEGGAA